MRSASGGAQSPTTVVASRRGSAERSVRFPGGRSSTAARPAAAASSRAGHPPAPHAQGALPRRRRPRRARAATRRCRARPLARPALRRRRAPEGARRPIRRRLARPAMPSAGESTRAPRPGRGATPDPGVPPTARRTCGAGGHSAAKATAGPDPRPTAQSPVLQAVRPKMDAMPARGTVTLFHVRGIRIGVDYSWFFVLFLIIIWLSGFYRDASRDLQRGRGRPTCSRWRARSRSSPRSSSTSSATRSWRFAGESASRTSPCGCSGASHG